MQTIESKCWSVKGNNNRVIVGHISKQARRLEAMATSTGVKRRNSGNGASHTDASAATNSGATAVNGERLALPFAAATLRSGNVVVLGMRVDTALNCAGMARFRVFQGHVEVLGFQPALGTYYSLYSPKWNSLLVLEGRTNAQTRSEATKSLLDAAYQAPFRDSSRQLLALDDPSVRVEMDDEHAADALAQDMAEDFPIVLVLRAIPVSFGNLTCFYELSNATAGRGASEPPADVVLPGFKLIVTRDEYDAIEINATAAAPSTLPMALTERQYHDWKSRARVLTELTVPDAIRTIQVTHAWRTTADAIEASVLETAATGPAQRIVVCGAKGVGKSTFCRYLVNRLLSHCGVVAFLDTDLGQSELTPPGLVSLHALVAPVLGPGFTHMTQPLRSFFCGGTNPGTDPLQYMRAVTSLLDIYSRKWPAAMGVPLVINTDGWIKSMGHDLLCSVIEHAVPHHVVQLLATTKSKQFAVPTTGDWTVHGVAPWDPSGVTQPPRSSKDMRLYRWHQYFLGRTRVLDTVPRAQLQNLHVLTEKARCDALIARAYAHAVPFAVAFDSVDVSFAGASVSPSQLLVSLNNSVVGLCVNPRRPPLPPQHSHSHHDSAIEDSDAHDVPTPPRILLSPAHAPCLGIGLIRAVDVERRLLFVLSPLPHALLARVNLLVRGNFPLASLVVDVDDPVQAPYAVTDVLPSEGTGAAAMQSRNNIKRKRDDKTPSSKS